MWNENPDEHPYDDGAPAEGAVAAAVELITAYQLGALSRLKRALVARRLRRDPHFAAVVEPILTCERALRAEGERLRAAVAERSAQTAERVIAMTGAAIASDASEAAPARPLAHDDAVDTATDAVRARHGGRAATPRWRAAPEAIGRWWLRQGKGARFCTIVGMFWATGYGYEVYADVVRSRIPPAEVHFVNAPLSTVMAEVRRRYHVNIVACDTGFNLDYVTLTLRDAPLDTVLRTIRLQTLRWAHWSGTNTIRLQPELDYSRSVWYNLTLFARSYTWRGCHR